MAQAAEAEARAERVAVADTVGEAVARQAVEVGRLVVALPEAVRPEAAEDQREELQVVPLAGRAVQPDRDRVRQDAPAATCRPTIHTATSHLA